MKKIRKLERILRKDNGRYDAGWMEDHALDLLWDGYMVGWLRSMPFDRPENNAVYQRASQVSRIRNGKRKVRTLPRQLFLSDQVVPSPEWEYPLDESASGAPDPFESLDGTHTSESHGLTLAFPPDYLSPRATEDTLLRDALKLRVQAALLKLKPADRLILDKHVAGMPQRAIGAEIGKSHQTVMRSLKRSRAFIRRQCHFDPSDLAKAQHP